MPEKDVLYILPAGSVTGCAFASQDILRRLERADREQSFMCNQAAGLSMFN